jgi:hypothetical protein
MEYLAGLSHKFVQPPSQDATQAVEWVYRLEATPTEEESAVIADLYTWAGRSAQRTAYVQLAQVCLRDLRDRQPDRFNFVAAMYPEPAHEILTAIYRTLQEALVH